MIWGPCGRNRGNPGFSGKFPAPNLPLSGAEMIGRNAKEFGMAAPPRKRLLNPEQRRALQLLASSPYGTTDVLMLARGFTRRTLAGLVRAELATARHEIVKAGDKTIDVGRVRITTARRWAVEG